MPLLKAEAAICLHGASVKKQRADKFKASNFNVLQMVSENIFKMESSLKLSIEPWRFLFITMSSTASDKDFSECVCVCVLNKNVHI